MNSSKQIRYGAIISYAAIFINIAIGLIYTPWMIKTIGKADYGLYTLAMSIISIFIFDFGLSSAITRYVAKYLAEGRSSSVGDLLGLIYKLYLGIDLLIVLILIIFYFCIPYVYAGLTPDEIDTFKIVFVVAATFSVVSFPFIPLNGIISAHEKFIQLKLCDLAHKLITVGLMSWCLLRGYGLYALVIVNAISGIITILLKLLVIFKETDVKVNWKYWDRVLLKGVLSFSIWVTIIALCQRLIFNIAPSILGIVSDSQNIAILGVAMTLEGYVYTFASAINGLFLPKVSRYVNDADTESINLLMVRVGRIQIFVISLIVFGFVATGKEFILLWLGDGYSSLYICAIILMIPSLIYLPMEVGNATVIAKGVVKYQARVFIVMAIVNVVLAFPLSYYWGVLGMSCSIFGAYMWRTIGMNYVFSKRLSLDLREFYKKSFLKMSPVLFLSLIVSLVLSFTPISSSILWSFTIKIIVFLIFYCILCWFFSFNDSEKQLIFSPIQKLMGRISR